MIELNMLLRKTTVHFFFFIPCVRPVFCMLPATASAEQWKTIELPVNKTVQANVLEIISPNLFYALPNGMPGKKPKFEKYLRSSFKL